MAHSSAPRRLKAPSQPSSVLSVVTPPICSAAGGKAAPERIRQGGHPADRHGDAAAAASSRARANQWAASLGAKLNGLVTTAPRPQEHWRQGGTKPLRHDWQPRQEPVAGRNQGIARSCGVASKPLSFACSKAPCMASEASVRKNAQQPRLRMGQAVPTSGLPASPCLSASRPAQRQVGSDSDSLRILNGPHTERDFGHLDRPGRKLKHGNISDGAGKPLIHRLIRQKTKTAALFLEGGDGDGN